MYVISVHKFSIGLFGALEVEYGLCELKDVLQPEQYGKKCGFPVVDK